MTSSPLTSTARYVMIIGLWLISYRGTQIHLNWFCWQAGALSKALSDASGAAGASSACRDTGRFRLSRSRSVATRCASVKTTRIGPCRHSPPCSAGASRGCRGAYLAHRRQCHGDAAGMSSRQQRHRLGRRTGSLMLRVQGSRARVVTRQRGTGMPSMTLPHDEINRAARFVMKSSSSRGHLMMTSVPVPAGSDRSVVPTAKVPRARGVDDSIERPELPPTGFQAACCGAARNDVISIVR